MKALITPKEVTGIAFGQLAGPQVLPVSEMKIIIAQERFLRPVLGSIYDRLEEAALQDFVEHYLKPPLAFFVKYSLLDELAFGISPDGIHTLEQQQVTLEAEKNAQTTRDSEIIRDQNRTDNQKTLETAQALQTVSESSQQALQAASEQKESTSSLTGNNTSRTDQTDRTLEHLREQKDTVSVTEKKTENLASETATDAEKTVGKNRSTVVEKLVEESLTRNLSDETTRNLQSDSEKVYASEQIASKTGTKKVKTDAENVQDTQTIVVDSKTSKSQMEQTGTGSAQSDTGGTSRTTDTTVSDRETVSTVAGVGIDQTQETSSTDRNTLATDYATESSEKRTVTDKGKKTGSSTLVTGTDQIQTEKNDIAQAENSSQQRNDNKVVDTTKKDATTKVTEDTQVDDKKITRIEKTDQNRSQETERNGEASEKKQTHLNRSGSEKSEQSASQEASRKDRQTEAALAVQLLEQDDRTSQTALKRKPISDRQRLQLKNAAYLDAKILLAAAVRYLNQHAEELGIDRRLRFTSYRSVW